MKKSNYFYANLIYFIIILGFFAIRLLSYFDVLSFMNGNEEYLLGSILQIGLMFILPVFLFSILKKQKPLQTLKHYGYKKISIKAIIISIIIGLIVFVLNMCIASFFNFVITLLGYEKLGTATTSTEYPLYMLFVNLLMTAVLPAICEETTHRGLLLKNYSSLGFKKAILISGLLFGLTHLNIEQFFYATLIGFLLGIITVLCGNIFPAIIIHFINNAINVLISYFTATSKTFNYYYEAIFNQISTGNFFLVVIGIFVVITILILLLAYLIYKLFESTAVKELKKVTEELSRKKLRDELMGELQPETISSDKVPMLIQRENKYFNIYIPAESLGFPIKQTYFPSLKEKTVFFGMLTLTSLLTLFTFIWNIL